MAQEYIKVLTALNVKFTVIGRGGGSAQRCEAVTGVKVIRGGLENFLLEVPDVCTHAIVAVGVEKLYGETTKLLDYGVTNVLVEKPAGLEKSEIDALVRDSYKKDAKVFVAYNRRFFASVLEAKRMIESDGGVASFHFEFTEWGHVIEPLKKGEGVKEKWFLGNSTHVVDLAFYLGGAPAEISCFSSGGLDWHPAASKFSGAGVSVSGALFNYQANWESAGRWRVEMLTDKRKLLLCPLEKLQEQKKGTVLTEEVESIDYSLDNKFKPGLFVQVQRFLQGATDELCNIDEQLSMFEHYNKMAGYLD